MIPLRIEGLFGHQSTRHFRSLGLELLEAQILRRNPVFSELGFIHLEGVVVRFQGVLIKQSVLLDLAVLLPETLENLLLQRVTHFWDYVEVLGEHLDLSALFSQLLLPALDFLLEQNVGFLDVGLELVGFGFEGTLQEGDFIEQFLEIHLEVQVLLIEVF